MIYTSGTTGKPKGAMRTGTDAGAVGALLQAARTCCDGPSVHLTTGPLYHSGPLSFALFAHARRRHHRGAAQVRRHRRGSAW